MRAGAPGFEPPTRRGDATPDVVCERGADQPPVVFEVELPETLVRRETVRRLAGLVAGAVDARVVLIVDGPDHEGAISDGRRLLRSAGLVQATLNGRSELRRIKIDPSLMKPDESEVLEDLIVAAVNDARAKVEKYSQDEMSKLTGGLPLPPGFKLPF